MKKYLISHHGLELGPLSIEEIVAKVRGKELDALDYIFDEGKADWVLFTEFPQLAENLKSSKPPKPPQGVVAEAKPQELAKVIQLHDRIKRDAHTVTEWFLLKGENRFGPFGYVDVLKMLQQKVIFPFDFVWHAGLAENWQRIAEIEEFKPETVRQLFNKTAKGKDLFVERKFRRKPFAGRVLIHDNLTLWKGEGFEISRGGVGICMPNSVVIPGQQIFVHFKKHEEWPAFNAVCEVVSKKFVSDDSPVQYGLRFLSMSQEVQEDFNRKAA